MYTPLVFMFIYSKHIYNAMLLAMQSTTNHFTKPCHLSITVNHL